MNTKKLSTKKINKLLPQKIESNKKSSLLTKLEEVNRKTNETNTLKENLTKQLEINTQKQAELDKQTSIQKAKLEAIAELSAQQAKEQLIQLMQEEAKADAMVLVKDIMDEAQTTANMEAKKVIIKSIQRVGVEALWKMLSLFLISKMTKLKVASLGEKEEISELLKT